MPNVPSIALPGSGATAAERQEALLDSAMRRCLQSIHHSEEGMTHRELALRMGAKRKRAARELGLERLAKRALERAESLGLAHPAADIVMNRDPSSGGRVVQEVDVVLWHLTAEGAEMVDAFPPPLATGLHAWTYTQPGRWERKMAPAPHGPLAAWADDCTGVVERSFWSKITGQLWAAYIRIGQTGESIQVVPPDDGARPGCWRWADPEAAVRAVQRTIAGRDDWERLVGERTAAKLIRI